MLINKPIKDGTIITVKLNSGEELVARFESDDGDTLDITKVRTVAHGQEGLGIIPWMMTTQRNRISINKSTVVAYTTTDDEVAKSYQQNTTDIRLV
jgi:hypothetical protein